MSLKSLIRPYLRPLVQYAAIGRDDRQTDVDVRLEGVDLVRDVTRSHAIASVKPFLLVVKDIALPQARLVFHDRISGRQLGQLAVELQSSLQMAGAHLGLYAPASGRQRCVGWPLRPWNAWLQENAILRNTQDRPLSLSPEQTLFVMIAYICPRPVFLVSVSGPEHINLFPMDLIGIMDDGTITLALRSKSRSTPIIQSTRRLVLSAMPASTKQAVYDLAQNHRSGLKDWTNLPFAVKPLEVMGIPYVAEACSVRGVEILDHQTIGSHCLYVGRIVTEQSLRDVPQLHHTAGFYQHYRSKRGRPFAPA